MRLVARAVLALFAAALLCAGATASHAAGDVPAANSDAYKLLPLRRDVEDSGVGWKVLAFLGVVGVAAFLISARGRKAGRPWALPGLASAAWPKARPQRIEIVERRHLNAACTVCLVRWDGEEVLLGCTSQSVSVISRRPVAPLQQEQV